MTTILLVCGSQRAASFNARLLQHVAAPLGARCRLDTLAATEVALPLFDQDRETDPALVAHLTALHRRFAAADGSIVACPEYNGQPTPYLKNLIDWVSRLAYLDPRLGNPFADRPVLLCSASTGWSGGAVALPLLRSLFGYVGGVVLGDAVTVAHADQAWDGAAYCFDPAFDAGITAAAERLLRLAQDFAARQTH